MGATSKVSVKRKVFPKGQIVIPVALRKKFHIEIGDHVDVIPKADGILLKPVLPKKGKKWKPKIEKADINRATEAGFIEGRKK